LNLFLAFICECIIIIDIYEISHSRNRLLAWRSLASGAIRQYRGGRNFYGGIAHEIAGHSADVVSILSNPNQDPHEFQTDATTAKAVEQADIVIYSGIGYDDWMQKLLGLKGKPGRTVICVADLIGAKTGDNPHIWYEPRTMPALADKLGEILKQPGRAATFDKSMGELTDEIGKIKSARAGTSVTATEPVFGYMAGALGFKMLNYSFQIAVMNDTEPSFKDTSGFEKSLTSGAAKILFYNSQVSDPVTQRMQSIAKSSNVPVVGVTETQPPGSRSYVAWMMSELKDVETAFAQAH
jgi:zinc/manganese transport system substrate-binding protein